MTRREAAFATLTFLVGVLYGVSCSVAAQAGADAVSVAGWLQIVGPRTQPVLFWLIDCHGKSCDAASVLPDDAIRMAGRSGDAAADQRIADWLIQHDGQRVRVTWTVAGEGRK